MSRSKKVNFVSSIMAIAISIIILAIPSNLQASQKENNANEKAREILKIFKQISSIPRCPTHEKGISKWLNKWAKSNGLKVKNDQKGNLVIKVPASKGFENAPVIVLQGHLDMVCEKTPNSKHDFSKDPIKLVFGEEWLTAHETTLGADNGIGIAICMALVNDKYLVHPPLELLFTVEEEIGLRGAAQLKPGLIKGKIFINVDSEEEGVLTMGSAGATVHLIKLPVSMKRLPQEIKVYHLRVTGLRGGHSGLDIHRKRANAIKILAKALLTLYSSSQFNLVSIQGGTKVNSIARDSEAVLAFAPAQLKALQEQLAEFEVSVQNEYLATEKSLSITLSPFDKGKAPKSGFSLEDTERAIKLLGELPNGVYKMSSEFEGNVETSNNLGLVYIKGKELIVESLERSAAMQKLDALHSEIQAAAKPVGAKAKIVGSLPAWEPNKDSQLLKRCQVVYRSVFGKEPDVSVVHGGLECSVIGARYPHMDMISIGPTIVDAHSPDEKLYISSVAKVWKLLAAILASYGE
jgi:dipeptidase D